MLYSISLVLEFYPLAALHRAIAGVYKLNGFVAVERGDEGWSTRQDCIHEGAVFL